MPNGVFHGREGLEPLLEDDDLRVALDGLLPNSVINQPRIQETDLSDTAYFLRAIRLPA